MTTVILLVLSLVFLILAAFNFSLHPRVNALGLGLAFFVLAQLVPLLGRL